MSKPNARSHNSASPSGRPLHVSLLLIAASFAAGMGTGWLMFRGPGGVPGGAVPTYLLDANNAGLPNQTPASTASQPDVSRMQPDEAALTLGNWNYDLRNWPKAIEWYQRALALGLDTPDLRTDLGNAHRFSGEPRQALEQYRIARRLNPQHENSLYNMATLYGQMLGDPAGMRQACQEYLSRFPNGEKAEAIRRLLEQGLPLTGGS